MSFAFSSQGIAPKTGADVLPNGDYLAHVTASELKPTKDGSGKYLQLEWTVLDGPQQGRKVWQRLNVVNKNPTAQEIAQGELSAVCHATGVLAFNASQELHNKPCTLRVTVKKGTDGYDDSNVVKSVKPLSGVAPAAAVNVPAAASASAGAVPKAAPGWAAKKPATQPA